MPFMVYKNATFGEDRFKNAPCLVMIMETRLIKVEHVIGQLINLCDHVIFSTSSNENEFTIFVKCSECDVVFAVNLVKPEET